jgi:hypothetical protein
MKQVKIQGWDNVYHQIQKIMGAEGKFLYDKWWHSSHDDIFWQVSVIVIRELDMDYHATSKH